MENSKQPKKVNKITNVNDPKIISYLVSVGHTTNEAVAVPATTIGF